MSGGAKGADSFAEAWAKERNIKVQIFLPDWEKHGKSAGYIRNGHIIAEADACIAFWDGESKGTKLSISLAEMKGIPLKIIKYES